jgi:hypothetical protein
MINDQIRAVEPAAGPQDARTLCALAADETDSVGEVVARCVAAEASRSPGAGRPGVLAIDRPGLRARTGLDARTALDARTGLAAARTSRDLA